MTAAHNKNVLVTGGASGIGRLIAIGCASLGATVTIWDLDLAGAETVALEAAEAGASGVRALSTLPAMRLLPVWVFDQLTDLFGLDNAMDAFTGRGPMGDA